jgi:hypothetical protein
LRLLLGTALSSAIMSNTAVVATLINTVKKKIPLLILVSYYYRCRLPLF